MDLHKLSITSSASGSHPAAVLHGLFGAADNWRSVARQLSNLRPLELYDAPGHGASPWIDPWTYPLAAASYARLWDGSAPRPLIGHSMGGKTALALAQLYPHLVSTLVVVDIGPFTYPAHHHKEFGALQGLQLVPGLDRKAAVATMAKSLDGNTALAQFFAKSLDFSGDRPSWKFDLNGLYRDYNHILDWPEELSEGSDLPILFLAGENSSYQVEERFPEIKEIYPRAHLQLIEGAGHWVHAENPAATVRAIESFWGQYE